MKLEKLGLRARWDFVLHLPLRYEDETTLTPLSTQNPITMPVESNGRRLPYPRHAGLVLPCRARLYVARIF